MTAVTNAVQFQQPIGANSVKDAKPPKYDGIVVNPPLIAPYSFYDDLKKGDGFFKEALKIVATKDFVDTKTPKKQKFSLLKTIFWSIITITVGVLAYKNRSNIANFLRKLKS